MKTIVGVKRTLVLFCFVTALILALVQPGVKRVTASATLIAVEDTFICSDTWMRDVRPWNYPYFIVGGDEPDDREWDAFIKFNLSSLGIPVGSTIESAALDLGVYYSMDVCFFWCERITSNWDQKLVDWNHQPSVDAATKYACFGSSALGHYDVKPIVDKWVNQGKPNYGFALMRGYRGSSYVWYYYSSESGYGPAYEPRLTITWSYNALTITTDSTTTQPAALVMELRVTRTTEYRTTTVSSTTIAVTTTNTTVTRTL